MRPADNIHKLIKNTKIKTNPEVNKAVLDSLLDRMHRAEGVHINAPRQNIWRIIMKNKVTKIAAAAVVIIAVVLSITFLGKSVTPAYALEQTIEASRDIHTLYFEWSSGSEYEPSKECWVTFDEHGTPQNIRTNLHKHWGDSLIAHVWKYGETKTWCKDENTLQLFESGPAVEMMLRLVRECDPKTALQSLYDRQANGDVTIKIKEPPNKDKPIIVKATFLPGRYIPNKPTQPSFRDIFYIDQNTKLITSIEVYELKDGVYEYNGVWQSFKYDETFEAGIFDIEDEVPDDVKRLPTIN